VDEVIKPGVALDSACGFLARQGMKTKGVHRGTTWALMTFTDGTAQAESHSYPDGAVLEEQTAGTDYYYNYY